MGVDSAKDLLHSRLRIGTPGPGYLHFPDTTDRVFFEQLTAERLVTKYRAGRPVREWTPIEGRRNEALDVTVLALAALAGLGPAVDGIARRVDPANVRRAVRRLERIGYLERGPKHGRVNTYRLILAPGVAPGGYPAAAPELFPGVARCENSASHPYISAAVRKGLPGGPPLRKRSGFQAPHLFKMGFRVPLSSPQSRYPKVVGWWRCATLSTYASTAANPAAPSALRSCCSLTREGSYRT